jgi:hypothetical protein
MYRDLVVKLISFEGVIVSDTLGVPMQYSVEVTGDVSNDLRSLHTITPNYDQSIPALCSYITRWLCHLPNQHQPPCH